MTLLSRARTLFQSPADRRLAEAKAEAWSDAPKPSAALARTASTPAALPPIDWARGDREPGPATYAHVPGYHDHTFQDRSAPQSFEGFGLDRVRRAVALHRLGNFYESSTMAVALMSFAPVLAALQQAVARILATPRHVRGGDRGLARLVASEVEEAIVPQGSLLPSPYLPPELWGTMAIYLRNMGFCVLQHVDGDPDPVTGIRPRYTRIWEPWAVQRLRNPAKWIAYTTEGAIEIKNDGKFTLVIDENEGHLTGAVVALGEPVLGGIVTMCARNGWLDFFGDPKLYATLPEKVPTHGEAGNDFERAVETIYAPAGRGVLPYGSTLQAVALPGVGASQFREALYDAIALIGMIYLGSGGTMSNEGVYVSPGFFGVQHDLIARPTAAMIRGLNQGHIAPYCDGNYGAQIVAAKRAGTWKYPILGVDLADPDQDARIESVVKRETARTDILDRRRASGIDTTQTDVDSLSEDLGLRNIKLAAGRRGAKIEQWHVENKQVAPDEVRADLGLDPMPDGTGGLGQLAKERDDGKDKTGPAPSAPTGAPGHAPSGGGSPAGPAALLAFTSRHNAPGGVVTYSEDQERADDGKFGSGGGGGGGSGGDAPKAGGHDRERAESTERKAAKSSAKFEKTKAKLDVAIKKSEAADGKADAARDEHDEAEAAQKAKDKEYEKALGVEEGQEGYKTDEELEAAEKESSKERGRIEKLSEKAERLDDAASDLSWKVEDLRTKYDWQSQEADDDREHADFAKLSDDEYGAKVTARADEAAVTTSDAEKHARDLGQDENSWSDERRMANVMAESQERWEWWRDAWTESREDKQK